MTNLYPSRLLLAPSHRSSSLPGFRLPPKQRIDANPLYFRNQQPNTGNQKSAWDEYKERNWGQFAWLKDQGGLDTPAETGQQSNLPKEDKKSKKGKENSRKREKKRKALHEKENRQLSRVLTEMKAYELRKSGFTEVSRSNPITIQYPDETTSRQLLEHEEVEDWSTAINALETQRLKQDVEDRFLNLTRKAISPKKGIKYEVNVERGESDMDKDDSNLEEGEIREFRRQLPKKIKFDPVLEVDPKIKQEHV